MYIYALNSTQIKMLRPLVSRIYSRKKELKQVQQTTQGVKQTSDSWVFIINRASVTCDPQFKTFTSEYVMQDLDQSYYLQKVQCMQQSR